jgi:hypothetical protein
VGWPSPGDSEDTASYSAANQASDYFGHPKKLI